MKIPAALHDLYDLAESEESRKSWALNRTGRVLLEMVPICQQILQAFHEEDFDRAVEINPERQRVYESWENRDPLDERGQQWGRQSMSTKRVLRGM